MFQDILLSYNQASETDQLAPSKGWIPVAVVAFGVFLYSSELTCYLKIFHYLYLYNNGAYFLPPEVKKDRNKTNAQTMVAQFYFFITDTFYAIFLFVAFIPGISPVSSDLKDLGIFLKTLDFGLMSFIHCFLIPTLRRKMLASVAKLFVEIRGSVPRLFRVKLKTF